eukprot:SAG31_NODE_1540_length_7954_cov_3.521961_4_plen_290_part_00
MHLYYSIRFAESGDPRSSGLKPPPLPKKIPQWVVTDQLNGHIMAHTCAVEDELTPPIGKSDWRVAALPRGVASVPSVGSGGTAAVVAAAAMGSRGCSRGAARDQRASDFGLQPLAVTVASRTDAAAAFETIAAADRVCAAAATAQANRVHGLRIYGFPESAQVLEGNYRVDENQPVANGRPHYICDTNQNHTVHLYWYAGRDRWFINANNFSPNKDACSAYTSVVGAVPVGADHKWVIFIPVLDGGGSQVRVVTFSFLCPLLEKYGTFIARCSALIEKVSTCASGKSTA